MISGCRHGIEIIYISLNRLTKNSKKDRDASYAILNVKNSL